MARFKSPMKLILFPSSQAIYRHEKSPVQRKSYLNAHSIGLWKMEISLKTANFENSRFPRQTPTSTFCKEHHGVQ